MEGLGEYVEVVRCRLKAKWREKPIVKLAIPVKTKQWPIGRMNWPGVICLMTAM